MDPLSDGQENKRLKVQVGEPFRITLWEDRTHGYSWQPRLDSIPIELLVDDYERTINVDTADSGRRTFEMICSQPGQFEIVFEKQVGWQFTSQGSRTVIVEAD